VATIVLRRNGTSDASYVRLGKSRTFSSRARQHYQANFGPPNHRISIGNHTVLLLDSPLLVEEDYTRSAAEVDYGQWPGLTGGTIQFVKEVAKGVVFHSGIRP